MTSTLPPPLVINAVPSVRVTLSAPLVLAIALLKVVHEELEHARAVRSTMVGATESAAALVTRMAPLTFAECSMVGVGCARVLRVPPAGAVSARTLLVILSSTCRTVSATFPVFEVG